MSVPDTVAAATALQQKAQHAVSEARNRLETALLENCRLNVTINRAMLEQIQQGDIFAKPDQAEAMSILRSTIAEIAPVHRQLIQQCGLPTCRQDGCQFIPETDGYCISHRNHEPLGVFNAASDDDRLYCHNPDCPNWENFPYGQPDEHVTGDCNCQICEEEGTQPKHIVDRHRHGVYEKLRRDGFRLVRCAVPGCDHKAFVPKQALQETKEPWRCGQCLWTGAPV